MYTVCIGVTMLLVSVCAHRGVGKYTGRPYSRRKNQKHLRANYEVTGISRYQVVRARVNSPCLICKRPYRSEKNRANLMPRDNIYNTSYRWESVLRDMIIYIPIEKIFEKKIAITIPVHGLENIALNYWQPVNQARGRGVRG